ncbi:MAG TPA: ABC transporter permease [Verrucomicrobiae bacterium]|nr:ABC transporter permease [Verrucomicrobiae bacterium]
MFSFPVIKRELQVEARKRSNYWARFFWGLGAMGAVTIALLVAPEKSQNGSYLFNILHFCLAVMLLLISPITAADAISREQREGTLGLLFLTPLKARDIVLSKLGARLFRVFYFWLMFVPFLMLPMLTGGLPLQQFALSIALLLSLLVSGIAVAMIASAMSTNFTAAVFRALFFAALVNLAIGALVINLPALLFPATGRAFAYEESWVVRICIVGPYFILAPGLILEWFQQIYPSRYFIPSLITALIICPLTLLIISFWICTRRITRYAEASIETTRQAALRKRFLTPVLLKDRFRESMRRKLQKNPFVWLEYRSPSARSARWAALLGLVAIQTLLITNNPSLSGIFEAQTILLWCLLMMITLKSTTSFQYEKESGAIELILVTPITERKLVSGRLAAVLQYYLPIIIGLAAFTAAAFWLDSRPLRLYDYELRRLQSSLNLWLSVFSIPVVGLFFALRCKTYIPALLWTSGLAIFAAPVAWAVWQNLVWYLSNRLEWSLGYLLGAITESLSWWLPFVAYPIYHLLLVLRCRAGAIRALEKRSFAAQSTA